MQSDADDAIAALGVLALGSRLKRLSDTMLAQAGAAIAAEGYNLTPAQVILMLCVDHYGALTVTQAAERMGVSQPAMTRAINLLRAAGHIDAFESAADARQTELRLSRAGAALIAKLRADYLPRVEAAAQNLVDGARGDFLAQIAHVERALADTPLDQRIRAKKTSRRAKP